MPFSGNSTYVSVDEAKAHLRLTGTTWDDQIRQTLPGLCEMADMLTGRDQGTTLGCGFNTHGSTYRYYLAEDRRGIQLPEWPIQSVVGLTLGDTALKASEFRLFGREGFIQFTTTDGVPVSHSGKLDVTVVAGYPTVPSSVALGVLRCLSYIKQRADEEGLGAELLGPQQTTWRAIVSSGRLELHDIMFSHVGGFELDYLTTLEQGEVR